MSDLPTILPPNAQAIERDLEQLSSRHKGFADPLKRLWKPQTCPENILPWLAWAFSVDKWDANWSEDAKRAAIAASVEVHRRKGTIGAVKRALAAAGYGAATVIERENWETHDATYKHDGSITYSAPDHWAEYRVQLTRPITIEQANQVRAILADVAPARCLLKALDFTEALNNYDARITYDGQFTHGVA
ncbi:phage tail protein I [Ruegeria marisrubri]|uniref:phage tail protein I n=1 Tax=Ruegeria marisrubri TaxID=1685379 RepID=UPI001CD39514|nr:phage tail protein I [Ruegeria marisrubri]MCA0905133.1 phage tail protein I [Ruegeria marisrubri]